MSILTIAAWQAEGRLTDVEANTDSVRAAARWAKEMEADLLITPEMFLSGYNVPRADLEAQADVDHAGIVAGIAQEVGIGIVAGVPEFVDTPHPAGLGIYNTSVLVSDTGEVLMRHRKYQLFGDLDRGLFLPGVAPVTTAEFKDVTIGSMICFDVEFPESVRAARRAGVELLAVPTAQMIGYAPVNEHVIPARAWDNGLYLAYVNRVGTENDLTYIGQSSICSPYGERLAGLGAEAKEEMLFATIDTEIVAQARTENPYLEELRG